MTGGRPGGHPAATRAGSPTRSAISSRTWLWLGSTVAAVWIAWQAWVHRGHLVDDAFIGLRYARNLLTGHGPVFNPGEWVEGITNVGWVLPLAGLAGWLGGPDALPVLAEASGLACVLGAVLLAARAHRHLAPEAHPVEAAAVPILAATQPELTYFSVAGMETGLAALLLVLGLWCLLPDRPRLLTLAALGGLLFTVRPETLPIVPAVLVALGLARSGVAAGIAAGIELRRPRLLRAGGLFALLVAAVTGLRLAVYGTPLPNTFVAKGPASPAEIASRALGLLGGTEVNVPFPYGGSLLIVAGGAALLWVFRGPGRGGTAAGASPGAAWIYAGVAVGAGLAFGVYAPPDWTGMGRYFGPFVPLAAILFVRGTAVAAGAAVALFRTRSAGSPGDAPDGSWPPARSAIARQARGRPGRTAVAVLGLLVVAANLWRTGEHLSPAALAVTPGFILASEELVPPARWIDRNLPEDAVIAARRIGVLGYHGRRPVFDYAFGLTDPGVARAIRRHGAPFDTPAAPELADLWRRARPDALLEDMEVIGPLLRAAAARGRGPAVTAAPEGATFRVHGLVYEVARTFAVGDVEWVLALRRDRPEEGRPLNDD